MLLEALAIIACLCAALPACLFHRNLRLYTPPPTPRPDTPPPAVAVLIPARNEACTIQAAVEAALHSQHVTLEVLVLDDHSTDATAQIVRDIAGRDTRVRLLPAPPLPSGWCGKQYACAILATHTTQPLLAFIDADVRLAPQGLAQMATFLNASGADLVSGLPRQETGTLLERLLIPLIHFLLLGFLPLWRMRQSRHPAYGAGCGQLFIARRQAYVRAGGHAAIRTSLHDGLTLPRAFRTAGLRTDLCDATTVATCRMYRGARDVWYGLAKNATEGLAKPTVLGPVTILLLAGQVLPVPLCGLGAFGQLSSWAWSLAVLSLAAAYYPRLRAVRRFEQSRFGALLHPCGILVLLVLQWYACVRAFCGRPAIWKGRVYSP